MYFTRVKHFVFSACMLACAAASPAAAANYQLGDIVVTDPWARAMAPAAKTGAAYLVITNKGNRADRLVAIRSDVADRVEIHEMHMEKNVMKMRRLPKGVEIAPHGSLTLQPGGYHLMFLRPHKPFKDGEHFTASLVFEKAGKVDVSFAVKSMSGQPDPHAGHDMQGHAH